MKKIRVNLRKKSSIKPWENFRTDSEKTFGWNQNTNLIGRNPNRTSGRTLWTNYWTNSKLNRRNSERKNKYHQTILEISEKLPTGFSGKVSGGTFEEIAGCTLKDISGKKPKIFPKNRGTKSERERNKYSSRNSGNDSSKTKLENWNSKIYGKVSKKEL